MELNEGTEIDHPCAPGRSGPFRDHGRQCRRRRARCRSRLEARRVNIRSPRTSGSLTARCALSTRSPRQHPRARRGTSHELLPGSVDVLVPAQERAVTSRKAVTFPGMWSALTCDWFPAVCAPARREAGPSHQAHSSAATTAHHTASAAIIATDRNRRLIPVSDWAPTRRPPRRDAARTFFASVLERHLANLRLPGGVAAESLKACLRILELNTTAGFFADPIHPTC